jgi:hypothetical protein
MTVDLDDCGIYHGVFHVRFIAQGIEHAIKDIAFDPFAEALKTVFHLPNSSGKSRQGLFVRAIHKTAFMKSQQSLPVRPGELPPEIRTLT